MKEIILIATENELVTESTDAGQEHEHLATELNISLTETIVSDNYNYYLIFQTENQKKEKTGFITDALAPEAGKIRFSLPSAVMAAGTLDLQLRITEKTSEKVIYTAKCVPALHVKESIPGQEKIDLKYDGLLEEKLNEFDEKIGEIYEVADFASDMADKAEAEANRAKEVVDGIKVGTRNLIKGSDTAVSTSAYLMRDYPLGDNPPQHLETVTVQIKGQLGAGKDYFGIFNSGGSGGLAQLTEADKGADGVYRKTFTWRVGATGNTFMRVYAVPNSVTGVTSSIDWVTLTGGNTQTDWMPAPEDVYDKIDGIQIGGRNFLQNSSFAKSLDKWTLTGTNIEITELDGKQCGHITGALNTDRHIGQSVLTKMEPGKTYTASGWFQTRNIVQGTTQPFVTYYMASYYLLNGSNAFFDTINIPLPSNTTKWTRLESTFTIPAYCDPLAVMTMTVFARDCTGDVYFRDLKLESGNKATDWEPAPEDMLYLDDVTDTVTQGNKKPVTSGAVYNAIANAGSAKRHGVRFDGGTNPGTRMYDAVGLVANVGTDTQTAINDFDGVYPWNARRRCCGYFDGKGNFVVNAYEGEPGYTTDGSNGEVWIEHSLFYYRHAYDGDAEEIEISGAKLDGFLPAPIFVNADGTIRQKAYTAAYLMATVDGKATSRAGVFADVYSLDTAMTAVRTLGTNYTTTTTAEWYTECLYMWVEFATRDLQSVMAGLTNSAYLATDKATVAETGANRVIVANAVANKFVVGQTIGIGTTLGETNIANNRIVTAIEAYDASNKSILFDGQSVNIAVGNVVWTAAYINGSCDNVLSSSGSPVSNTSGKYNCIYRGKETPYGSAFECIADVLLKREGTGTTKDPYYYDIYYIPDPTKYSDGAITVDYVKLNFRLPPEEGHVKKLGFDSRYPHLRLPVSIGADTTTYYSDYYYRPAYEVCAAIVGGYVQYESKAGPCCWNCYNSPSNAGISRRARLSYHHSSPERPTNAITQDSTQPVTSGAVYDAMATIADRLDAI